MLFTRSQTREGLDRLPSERIIVTSTAASDLIDTRHNARFNPCIRLDRPAMQASSEDEPEVTQQPRTTTLSVTFSTLPRNGSREFTIGSSDDADIKYGSLAKGISKHQLLLGFDEHNQVIIKDISRNGMNIIYSNEHYRHSSFGDQRKPPRWVIPPDRAVTIIFTQNDFGPCITLRAPDYSTNPTSQFAHDIRRFRALQNNPVPVMGGLGVSSRSATTGGPDLDLPLMPAPKRGQYAWIKGRKIAAGAFGVVWEVFNSTDWRMCAGKQMDHRDFAVEAGLLQDLKHPHIARYIDQETRHHIASILVMEYCAVGDLSREHLRSAFSKSQAVQIMAQATSALEYLHRNGVAHRDLKPANILVRSRQPLNIAVSDFGLATKDRPLMSSLVGTPIYMAPEVGAARAQYEWGSEEVLAKYDNKADIWSLGVVALFLKRRKGLPSFAAKENHPQIHAKAMVNLRDEWLVGPEVDAFDQLVRDMVQWDPALRPMAAQCAMRAAAIASKQKWAADEVIADLSGGTQAALVTEGQPSQHWSSQATIKPMKRKGSEGLPSSQDTVRPPPKKGPAMTLASVARRGPDTIHGFPQKGSESSTGFADDVAAITAPATMP